MKFVRYVYVISFLIILFFSYNQQLYPVEFFDLFSDSGYSAAGLKKVQEYNTEKNTFPLPVLDDKELFESIRDLSICRNKTVREYIYLYMTSGREYTIKSIEKSYIYIDIINNIIRENPDIPAEISLLPLLESGFEPEAVSRSNAVGLWQFLQSTSSHLGLQSNQWVEERRNIEKSTGAAVRHLRYLKKIFKKWDLALAAYNGGEGQVRRAIDKTGSESIWKLAESGTLSRETSGYVMRYAALVVIYRHQKSLGIYNEIKVPDEKKTVTVKINSRLNINEISKTYGIDTAEIKRYNPELKDFTVTLPFENYKLRLTEDSAKKYYRKEGTLYIGMLK